MLKASAKAEVDQSRALGVTDNPPVEHIDWHLEVDADAPAEKLEELSSLRMSTARRVVHPKPGRVANAPARLMAVRCPGRARLSPEPRRVPRAEALVTKDTLRHLDEHGNMRVVHAGTWLAAKTRSHPHAVRPPDPEPYTP